MTHEKKPPEKIEEASEKMEPNPVAESEISTQEETTKDENGKPTPNPTIESILKHESPAKEEVSIWGVPLLKDERSDVILLKFLRAREFKVKEAFAMHKKHYLPKDPKFLEKSVALITYNILISANATLKQGFPGNPSSSSTPFSVDPIIKMPIDRSNPTSEKGKRLFHTAVTTSDSVYNTW